MDISLEYTRDLNHNNDWNGKKNHTNTLFRNIMAHEKPLLFYVD